MYGGTCRDQLRVENPAWHRKIIGPPFFPFDSSYLVTGINNGKPVRVQPLMTGVRGRSGMV